jgi:hypothetical protein
MSTTKYCPSCGTQVNPEATFCANCGTPMNQAPLPPSGPVQPAPPPVYAAPPPKGASKKWLIIAVVAVVAIVIIAAVALALSGGSSGDTNNNNNSNGSNSNSQLAMTISGVNGYRSDNMFMQPDEGNYFVIAYANLTNKGASTMYVSPISVTMIGSDGKSYEYTWMVDSFDSGNLSPDHTAPIWCGFELPKGVTPATLKYDDDIDNISVNIPSSLMNLTVQEFMKITLVSVTDPATGSFPADPGNKYVTVTIEVTNLRSVELTLNPLYFTLMTTDGLTHDPSYAISPTVPDGLQGGAKATMSVSFEVASGTSPNALVFDDGVSVITINL